MQPQIFHKRSAHWNKGTTVLVYLAAALLGNTYTCTLQQENWQSFYEQVRFVDIRTRTNCDRSLPAFVPLYPFQPLLVSFGRALVERLCCSIDRYGPDCWWKYSEEELFGLDVIAGLEIAAVDDVEKGKVKFQLNIRTA